MEISKLTWLRHSAAFCCIRESVAFCSCPMISFGLTPKTSSHCPLRRVISFSSERWSTRSQGRTEERQMTPCNCRRFGSIQCVDVLCSLGMLLTPGFTVSGYACSWLLSSEQAAPAQFFPQLRWSDFLICVSTPLRSQRRRRGSSM